MVGAIHLTKIQKWGDGVGDVHGSGYVFLLPHPESNEVDFGKEVRENQNREEGNKEKGKTWGHM